MWGKPSVTAYIRPQRYTKEFVDREGTFTLSFYGEEYRKVLNLFGTVSGKDRDKIKEAGFTPFFTDGTVAFEEAEVILVCRKMYVDEIKPEKFIDKKAEEKWYPEKDYHTMIYRRSRKGPDKRIGVVLWLRSFQTAPVTCHRNC